MSDQLTLNVDVDGVVADLMGGFKRYLFESYDEELDLSLMTRHNMELSPALKDLDDRIDLHYTLGEYLSVDKVYENYCEPIFGAKAAIEELQSAGVHITFVTATFKSAPESYTSKSRWLGYHFPKIPIASIPSDLKWRFACTWGVDDRWDICENYITKGNANAFCFRQPWSEGPSGFIGHDWKSITKSVLGHLEMLGRLPSHARRWSGEF